MMNEGIGRGLVVLSFKEIEVCSSANRFLGPCLPSQSSPASGWDQNPPLGTSLGIYPTGPYVSIFFVIKITPVIAKY